MFKKLVALLIVFMVLGQAVAKREDSEEASHNGLGSMLFGYGVGRATSRFGRFGRYGGMGGFGGYGGYGGFGGYNRGWGGRGWGWKHNAQESESAEE